MNRLLLYKVCLGSVKEVFAPLVGSLGLLVGEDRKPPVRLWVRGRSGFSTAH